MNHIFAYESHYYVIVSVEEDLDSLVSPQNNFSTLFLMS